MLWGASATATMKKSNELITIPATIEISVVQLIVTVLVVFLLQYYVLKHFLAPQSASEQPQHDRNRAESTTSVTSTSPKPKSINNDKMVPAEKNGTSATDVKDVSTGAVTPIGTPSRSNIPVNRSSTGLSYRMEQEGAKKMSSEYTRRGQLWSKHASWNLPMAPRTSLQLTERQTPYHSQGLEHVTAILNKFDVDPRRGFLPSQDPLQRLPYARYHLWEDLGDDLPKLLGARLGQAREPLKQLPALATDKLVTDAELRRAHLLLCLFAHAYVWGGPEPLDVIPEGIAKPLWEVSKRLDMPPVLGHPSIVLYNWRRLDSEADICMENLSTLNNFFDGRDESWFYLITVEVEARGGASIVPIMLSIDAIQRYNEEQEHRRNRRKSRAGSNLSITSEDDYNQRDVGTGTVSNGTPALSNYRIDNDVDEGPYDRRLMSNDVEEMDASIGLHLDAENGFPYDEEALIGELAPLRVAAYVTVQLKKVAMAIKGMCDSLSAMREGCHPFIFYHRVRPFLSAWKHNPTLPHGVIYEGVSDERQQYYGGSAAQSSLLPFLDIALGVSHQSIKSQDFLRSMREYMPKSHREFLGYLEKVACVREFVVESLKNHGMNKA